MYLSFKNLKIRSKKGQQQSQNQRQSTNKNFSGWNRRQFVQLMQLQDKLQKTVQMTYLEAPKQQRR